MHVIFSVLSSQCLEMSQSLEFEIISTFHLFLSARNLYKLTETLTVHSSIVWLHLQEYLLTKAQLLSVSIKRHNVHTVP